MTFGRINRHTGSAVLLILLRNKLPPRSPEPLALLSHITANAVVTGRAFFRNQSNDSNYPMSAAVNNSSSEDFVEPY